MEVPNKLLGVGRGGGGWGERRSKEKRKSKSARDCLVGFEG